MSSEPVTPQAAPTAPKRGSRTLKLIALLKFVETFFTAAAGLAAIRLITPQTLDALSGWSDALPRPVEQRFVQHLVDQLDGLGPHRLHALGGGALLFAAIFLAEGVGLWLGRRWAEWLSIVATALFVPLEVLELLHHANATKLLALIVNLLIVAYLVLRVLRERRP